MIPFKGKFSCPECQLSLEFKALSSNAIACNSCKSLIRKDGPLKHYYDKVDAPLEDMTPIQIGTKGKVEGKEFEIIGRTRFDRNEGYFNQWHILFMDDSIAHLGDCYGELSVFYQQSFKLNPQDFANASPPRIKKLSDKKEYSIVRYKNNFLSRAEGEIFEVPFTSDFISVELNNNEREMAIVFISSKKEIVAFTGKNYEFEELNFTNLRELNVWN